MDANEIRSELKTLCPRAELRLSDNEGYYWVSLMRDEPNGQTITRSTRLELNASLMELEAAVEVLHAHAAD